jgi:predicted helicase
MDDFRPPVENRHSRQNTQKQVNNPHLQFLRWGCEMLEHSNNHSVLAYIIPSTFLEAESYKYARKYITEHFSAAWVVAVDADARAGIRSDSMFKTQQGRTILIATRRYGETTPMSAFHFFDISRFAKVEKEAWLERDASVSLGLFTHQKTAMLKRRSKEILQRGLTASEEWLGSQDKPPQEAKVQAFVDALNDLGGTAAVDSVLEQNILDYSFKPNIFRTCQ